MNPSKKTTVGEPAWTYGKPAIFLHWLLAVLLSAMAALGWYMLSIEDQPGSGWYFDLHKSVGITVLVLVGLRLLWRLRHTPQRLPSSVPVWQRAALCGDGRGHAIGAGAPEYRTSGSGQDGPGRRCPAAGTNALAGACPF